MSGDPFDTEGVRRRVLDAWADSPARFREDANAEEDYALGGYRDRLIVELAQNASDAAAIAAEPGLLRIRLHAAELCVANTGAPLDAAGVAALASLRASAKRGGGTVGRFGVGFAAVLAVTGEPSILSTSGGVRFSAAATRHEVDALPGLADEVEHRAGAVPVLRLPWPAPGLRDPPFTTEVRLPLPAGVADRVRAILDAVDAGLLLALPGLTQIDIDGRVLRREDDGADAVTLVDGSRRTAWRVHRAAGAVAAEVLADRPVEERATRQWSVTWAVPLDSEGAPAADAAAGMLHAPTRSEEPISLPARLIATAPLAPDRRHVEPGRLADFVAAKAGLAYADLVAGLGATTACLALVPRATLAAAPFDASVVAAATDTLRHKDFLPRADGRGTVAPDRAVVADAASPALAALLAGVVDGLLPPAWSGRELASRLDPLGVRRLSTSDVVDLLSTVDRKPRWWRRAYAALGDTATTAELAGLPVPLADGRTVRGAAGILLPAEGLPAAAVSAFGLRVAHPDCVDPLLERLGARPATPRTVLADDRVRAAVAASYDEDDPGSIAEATLSLVAAAGAAAGEYPWLADLALAGDDGDWHPAGEMLLPGGVLAGVVTEDAPFARPGADLVRDWGATLAVVGVLGSFAVAHDGDVPLAEIDDDLDGIEDWRDTVLDRLAAAAPEGTVPPVVSDFRAVRDLELVAENAWGTALRELATPRLRAVTADPVTVTAGERRHDVPSYTRWWLSSHPVLGGERPDRLRTVDAVLIRGLYDVAEVDADLAALTGVLHDVEDALADVDRATDLLWRLADWRRLVDLALLREIYPRLATALDGVDVDRPDWVRVGADRVVGCDHAVVVDLPYLLPLLDRAVVPAAGSDPTAVAELLDVSLGSDLVRVAAPTGGRRQAWSAMPGAVAAAARCGAVVPGGQVAVHRGLEVGGVSVRWWPDGDVDHVDEPAGAGALGRALAWRLRRWELRAACVEALRSPDDPLLSAEDSLR